HCLLHGLATRPQKTRCIRHSECTGGSERGIFAERVTGDKLHLAREIQSRFALEYTQDGKRDGHKGRLGIFRKRQCFGRSFEDNGAELAAECSINFIKYLSCGGEICCKGLAHPDYLAALPRKYESDRHARCPLMFRTKIAPKDTAPTPHVKPKRVALI